MSPLSAAAAFRDAVKDALGRDRRAFEHHVFEEMREARAAFRLEAKSDAVADANSESRRGMIFGNHDGQAEMCIRDRVCPDTRLMAPGVEGPKFVS